MKTLSYAKYACLLLFLTTTFGFAQKYEISISLKSKSDTAVLGHFFAKNESMYVNNTVILKNGKGVFKGNKLPEGLYFIFNDRKRIDFVIGDSQQFGITADTADLINSTRFTSSPENDAFYKFNRYSAEFNVKMQQLSEQIKNATADAEKYALREKMQATEKERLEYTQRLAEENKSLFVGKFLKAIIPPNSNLPEPPKDAEGKVTDPSYVYRWYRAHYFDNFDLSDPGLLRTPLYENRVTEYLTKVIPLFPDTVCAEVDKILTKARADNETFRYLLITIFNRYGKSDIIGDENIWVHIADKWYIPFAAWSDEKFIETLKKEVTKKTPNLIGKPAPPIEMLMVLPPDHIKAAALDTAIKFDVQAGVMVEDFRKTFKSKYTALLFWDYNCSHCKKTIRELHRVYEEYKDKGLQVITVQSVNTKEAKGKWIDFVNENNLFGWVDAWAPFSAKWRELYNVSLFPTIFLLDENKTIISKGLAADAIKGYIDTKEGKR